LFAATGLVVVLCFPSPVIFLISQPFCFVSLSAMGNWYGFLELRHNCSPHQELWLIALLEAIDLSLVSFPLQFSPSVCMFGHVMRCLATHLDVVDCCLFTILHIFFFFGFESTTFELFIVWLFVFIFDEI